MSLHKRNLNFINHFGYFLLFLSFPLILFLARMLNPNSSGLGTHTQIGLPPCGFYTIFHKPCPSCGMTTSFSLLMRGRFLDALKTQPAAPFLFITSLFVWVTIPYHYIKGKKLLDLLELPYLLPILIANVVVIFSVWVVRLLF